MPTIKRTKEDKKIEADVDTIYKRLGNHVQVDIFDLGKVLDAGRDAGRNGESIEEALAAAITKYRKN